MSKKLFIILGISIFLIGAAAAYLVLNGKILSQKPLSPKEDLILKPQADVSQSDAKKYSGQPLSFLGDPEIISRYPAEFVEQKRSQLASAIEAIRKISPPSSVNYWIHIGLLKKIFDNYAGARDAWEYAKSFVDPNNSIVYYNLGNLYGFYLHDFKKAEANYKAAIARSPDPNYYLGLADFYKEVYKEKSDQIDDVLLAGLKVLPNDPNLTLNLAFYYKAIDDKDNAIKYFKQFLTLSGITGAQQKAIEDEVSALQNQSK